MNKNFRKWTVAILIAMLMGNAAVLPQEILPTNKINAAAESETRQTIDGVVYEFDTANQTASIVGLDNSVTSLTIPETVVYNDITYTVNSIGNYSCTKKENLKTLTIGSNIEYIGDMAFGNCYGLETVTINGTPDIQRLTFDGCKNLKNVTLDDNIEKISEFMFGNCTSLETINLPSNLKSIGSSAFCGCEVLTSITIPDSVQTISDSAFCGCTSMTYVKLPGNLTEIADDTFWNCTSLELPELPASLKRIGSQAFENTPSMTGTLVIPENITYIGSDGFHGSRFSEVYSKSSATIESNAFASNPNLEKVTLSGNEVLNFSFVCCENLSNLIVPFSAKNDWEASAFCGCNNLQYLNNEKVTYTYDESKEDVVFTNSEAMDNFIRTHFNTSDSIGFIDSYVDYYCEEVVKRYTNSDMTEIQKAKALHDWVINKVDYDHDNMYAPKNHCDCSVFINDTTVCDGYARGYAKLMNKAGIETDTCSNMIHAWAKCKIGDVYLNVDTCWDDKATPSYKWFLLTDKEVLEHEADSHRNAYSNPYSENPMGDLNMDKVVGVDDYRIMQKYLAGKTTLTYTQSLLADLNYDSILDNADLRLMKEKCQTRFDLNGDRKLNNLDHALLQYAIAMQMDISYTDYKNYKFDINNDGRIDWQDAKEMREFLEKYCGQDKNAYYRMGDLNLDGTVNRDDYVALQNYMNNKKTFEANLRLANMVDDFGIFYDDLEKLDELTKYEIGDVNFDNKVDVTDKDLILNHIVGNKSLPYSAIWYADINGDGAIDKKDFDEIEGQIDYEIGDVNFDHKINSDDKDLILNHNVGKIKLNDVALGYADFNRDGEVSMLDVVELSKAYNL